jgi:hypothetical protein
MTEETVKRPDQLGQRTELRTPLEVVNRMDWVLYYCKTGTGVIYEARSYYLEAKLAYQRAFMASKLAATGTVGDREALAQLDNWELYEAQEIAELALQHAREKRRDLEDELSKLQSEAGLIKKEMEMAR